MVSLVRSLREIAERRSGLRGRARLSVEREDGAVPFWMRQVLVVERPARLRVEVQGLLNQTLAVLVTDGDHFELLRSDDHSYRSGPIEPDLLWAEAGIALRPEEAVSLLLGLPVSGADWTPLRAERIGDQVRIELAAADGVVRLRATFDADGHLRVADSLRESGDLAWRAHFDDYREVDGGYLAHAITLDVAVGAAHAEISLTDVELNPRAPEALFRLRRERERSADPPSATH